MTAEGTLKINKKVSWIETGKSFFMYQYCVVVQYFTPRILLLPKQVKGSRRMTRHASIQCKEFATAESIQWLTAHKWIAKIGLELQRDWRVCYLQRQYTTRTPIGEFHWKSLKCDDEEQCRTMLQLALAYTPIIANFLLCCRVVVPIKVPAQFPVNWENYHDPSIKITQRNALCILKIRCACINAQTLKSKQKYVLLHYRAFRKHFSFKICYLCFNKKHLTVIIFTYKYLYHSSLKC